jgi:hypothetical protein
MSGEKIRTTVWAWLKHYLYGCFAKSWNGAISGVYGFIGVSTGAALNPQVIQAPNWEMAAYIFGVSFTISALGYFKDNPLPPSIAPPATNSPFIPAQSGHSPSSQP